MDMDKIAFIEFLSSHPFAIADEVYDGDDADYPVCYPAALSSIDDPIIYRAWAHVGREVRGTLPSGQAFGVVYLRAASWSGGRYERWERDYAIDVMPDGVELEWLERRPVIIDEDGDELAEVDVEELVLEHLQGLDDIDYAALLPPVVTEDIDIDMEDETMQTYTIQRDNNRDLRFAGELVAEVSSSDNNCRSDYSGATGRWTELRLYKTARGAYVCEQVGRTRWQGEHDRYSAAVCADTDEVIEYLGAGWLAKELYEAAGIKCIEEIE